jgi:hypothetical protein
MTAANFKALVMIVMELMMLVVLVAVLIKL